jgi:hypothetical protein
MPTVDDFTPAKQESIFAAARTASDSERGWKRATSCRFKVMLMKETVPNILNAIGNGKIDFQDLRRMKPELVSQVAERIREIVDDPTSVQEGIDDVAKLKKKLSSELGAILSTIKKVISTKNGRDNPIAADLAKIYQACKAHKSDEDVRLSSLPKANEIDAFMKINIPEASPGQVKLTWRDMIKVSSLNEMLGIYMSTSVTESEMSECAQEIVKKLLNQSEYKYPLYPAIATFSGEIKPLLDELVKDGTQRKKIGILEELWFEMQKEKRD